MTNDERMTNDEIWRGKYRLKNSELSIVKPRPDCDERKLLNISHGLTRTSTDERDEWASAQSRSETGAPTGVGLGRKLQDSPGLGWALATKPTESEAA